MINKNLDKLLQDCTLKMLLGAMVILASIIFTNIAAYGASCELSQTQNDMYKENYTSLKDTVIKSHCLSGYDLKR